MKLMDQLAHEQAAQLAEMRGNIAAIKSLTLHIRDFRKQARLRIRRLKTQKS